MLYRKSHISLVYGWAVIALKGTAFCLAIPQVLCALFVALQFSLTLNSQSVATASLDLLVLFCGLQKVGRGRHHTLLVFTSRDQANVLKFAVCRAWLIVYFWCYYFCLAHKLEGNFMLLKVWLSDFSTWNKSLGLLARGTEFQTVLPESNLKNRFIYFYFMYVGILSACVSIYCEFDLRRSEEGISLPYAYYMKPWVSLQPFLQSREWF